MEQEATSSRAPPPPPPASRISVGIRSAQARAAAAPPWPSKTAKRQSQRRSSRVERWFSRRGELASKKGLVCTEVAPFQVCVFCFGVFCKCFHWEARCVFCFSRRLPGGTPPTCPRPNHLTPAHARSSTRVSTVAHLRDSMGVVPRRGRSLSNTLSKDVKGCAARKLPSIFRA